MTWTAFFMSVFPTVLRIMESLISWSDSKGYIEQGRLQELDVASQALAATIAKAVVAAEAAAADHSKDPTDGAFDPDFKRKDE